MLLDFVYDKGEKVAKHNIEHRVQLWPEERQQLSRDIFFNQPIREKLMIQVDCEQAQEVVENVLRVVRKTEVKFALTSIQDITFFRSGSLKSSLSFSMKEVPTFKVPAINVVLGSIPAGEAFILLFWGVKLYSQNRLFDSILTCAG